MELYVYKGKGRAISSLLVVVLVLVSASSLFFPAHKARAENCSWTGGAGDGLASSAGNWSGCTGAPSTADNVTIDGVSTAITWDISSITSGSFTLGSSYTGTTTITATTFTANGGVTVSGGTLDLNGKNLTAGAGVTAAAGGKVWTSSAAGRYLTQTTATVGGAGTVKLYDMRVQGGGSATLGGNVTVANECDFYQNSAKTISLSSYTLTCGTFNLGHTTNAGSAASRFNAGTGTLTVTGAALIQDYNPQSSTNVRFNGDQATLNFNGGLTITHGDAIIDAGGDPTTLFMASSTVNITGDLTITNTDVVATNATVQVDFGNANVTITGNIVVSNTGDGDVAVVLGNSGTLTITGKTTITDATTVSTGATTWTSNAKNITYGKGIELVVGGSSNGDVTFTPSTGTNDINGPFYLAASSTATSNASLNWADPGSSYTVTASSSPFKIIHDGGAATFRVDTANSTFTFDGQVDQTITASTTPTFKFRNLTINNTGTLGRDDVIPASNIGVGGTLTITDGDLDLDVNDTNLTLGGNMTVGANGAWTRGSGTVTFEGATTFTDNSNIFNLGSISVSSTTAVAAFTMGSHATTSNLTIASGETFTAGAATRILHVLGNLANSGTFTSGVLDLDGTLTINSGSTFDSNTYDPAMRVGGDITVGASGTWDRGIGLLTIDGNSTYTDGSNAANLGEVSVASSTAVVTFTLGSSATSSGVVIKNGDTLNLGTSGYSLYLTDATASSTPFSGSGTFTPGTSVVVYKATSTPTNVASTTYSALTIDSGGNNNTFSFLGHTPISRAYLNTSGYIVETSGYIATSSRLSLDAATYNSGNTITITVTDPDENITSTSTDSLTVSAVLGSDTETVTLTETGVKTGVFTGTIAIDTNAVTASNGALNIPSGSNTLTVTFTDAQQASDSSNDTATVSVVVTSSGDSGSSGGGGGIFGLFGGGGGSSVTQPAPSASVPTTPPPPPETETPSGVAAVVDSIIPTFPIFGGDEEEEVLPPPPPPDELSELPRDLRLLVNKFPSLGETFSQVGIKTEEDLERLSKVTFTLPAFSDLARIPTEVVFARTEDKLINFNIALRINEEGAPEQQIASIAGTRLSLAVRPEAFAQSVKGYLTFTERKTAERTIPLDFGLAAAIFASPDAPNKQSVAQVAVDEELLVEEFEYSDTDGDGIYTAEVNAPEVAGLYEIITVIDYVSSDLGTKELRFTLVVDPEGYIYERVRGQELRISGAHASLFWKNPETNEFELWPGEEYQQENPQTTGATGEYAFLVPPGTYRLDVTAPGYRPYVSDEIIVQAGRGVHQNVEMKREVSAGGVLGSPWTYAVIFGVIVFLMLLRRAKKGGQS